MRVTHIMKVVLVAGAERHLLTLLPALRQLGVEPSILLLVEPDKPMDDFVDMAQAVDIPVTREVIYRHADVTLPPRLVRALRQSQPDVVHTHLLHADLYGVLLARMAGAKGVVTSRHNDNAFRRKLPMRLLHRGLWAMTDQGIAISDAIRGFCIDVEGVRPRRISTIRYGIESDRFAQNVEQARNQLREQLNLPPDAVLVGTMSRLIYQKGITYALRAFASIQENYPDAHLIITGDGILREALETEAQALNLRSHFLGWQPEPTHILAAYDVLLMPSLWEGFGLVMLEAMAQGIPIIGSRVSAIPEVIADEETGLLVPSGDVDGLATAIDRMLSDAQRRQAMGAAGKERLIERFSASHMAQKTLEVYEKALGQSPQANE